jgi:glycosyltransferase involved in cell wall biosynthesis
MEAVYLDKKSPLPISLAPVHDIFVATSWETAPMIAELAGHNHSAALFYYIQDYEADFYPPEATEKRRQVLDTYSLIPNKIVKTSHLQKRLADAGWQTTRIPPGMDLDIFYPRAGPPSTRPPAVIAMARPGTSNDQRGFEVLRMVYGELAKRRPGLQMTVFGSDELPEDFTGDNHGRVEPSSLPVLYSSAQVYIDVSRVHGFGRTGVEAMACGAACVLSDSGGISEYAVNGENALIVPVGDVNATADAVERLLDDAVLADTLARNGAKSVAGYSDYAAATVLESLFKLGLAETEAESRGDERVET